MVVGLGIDLVEIGRVRASWERFGLRFADKILTPAEQAPLPSRPDPVPYLAALFAAKEAAVKALGTGFRRGVHAKCVEVVHQASGRPDIAFLGRGLEVAREIGVSSAHVSLTHERTVAAAVVVLERD